MAGFGLINMNGRLYDPYLQRFLSPDPFVQSPGNAQNYNRYSYCLNNPLMYTDPSGYFVVPDYTFNNQDLSASGSGAGHSFYNGYVMGVGLDGYRGCGSWDEGYGVRPDGSIYDKKTGKTVDEGSANPEESKVITIKKQRWIGDGDYWVYKGETIKVYNNSYKTSVQSGPKSEGGGLDKAVDWVIDPLSNLATAGASIKYTSSNLLRDGYWLGKNGKYYSLTLTQKGTQGWNFYNNSATLANNSVKWLGRFGNALGVLSTAYNGYNLVTNPNWESGIETAVGVGSYFFWEVGAIYYPIKLTSKSALFNYNQNSNYGIDPFMDLRIMK